MLEQDQIPRFSSSNQEYGSGAPTWSSSKSSNGPGPTDTLIGTSINHYSSPSPNGVPNGSNASQQRRQAPAGSPTSSNRNGGESLASGFQDFQNTSLLYKTGEPLGSLSSSVVDLIKTKYAPNREEMKDKLVHALCTDTNVGILPGYKQNNTGGFTGGRFHGKNSSLALLHGDRVDGGMEGRGRPPFERLPSPVTRAQAAIGRTNEEIGLAKDILQGNQSKMSGIYRHPRGDPWVNASTPGLGADSFSLKRYKQDSYRRELETQMEQSRLRKEVELKKDRDGFLEHPFGSNYNSLSQMPYTFSMEESKASTNKHNPAYSDYLRTKSDAIGQKAPNRPPRTPQLNFSKPQEASSESMNDTLRSPWLDERNIAGFPAQVQNYSTSSQPMEGKLGQMQTNSYTTPSILPSRPPLQPQLPPHAVNPYYAQPPLPMYPYGYPCPMQQQPSPQFPFPTYPPQMPPAFPMHPPPPIYAQTPQYIPPSDSPRQLHLEDSKTVSPNFESFLRRQTDHVESLKDHKGFPSPRIHHKLINTIDVSNGDELAVDENAMRQYVWQTSDQLPSDDLKKAVYKTELKKQIIEKKRQNMMNREKEIEEDQKLEQNIQEYQERMRKQIETEQKIIRMKQMGGNYSSAADENASSSSIELKSKHNDHQWDRNAKGEGDRENNIGNDQVLLPEAKVNSSSQFDELPCTSFVQVNMEGKGDGDFDHLPEQSNPVPPENGVSEVNLTDPVPMVTSSSNQTITLHDTDQKVKSTPSPKDRPTSREKLYSNDELKVLSQIQNTLIAEIQKMEHLLGKRKHRETIV